MPKRKVNLDQYFTSRELVETCVQTLESVTSLEAFDLIVEPSAGSGRFLDRLPQHGVLSLDIAPQDARVQQADFFEFSPEKPGKILVIGNPPFGQRGSLAVRFINHAMKFADTVALILPRAFNKFTFINRVDRNFALEHSVNLSGVFEFDGDEVPVQTVFQVWVRSSELRELIKPDKEDDDFTMRHAHLSRISDSLRQELIDFADFSIPQVGARFRPADPSTLVKGSHWFIKLNPTALREAFDHLDFTFLEGTNTAHTSLSKADIVRAYREARERLGKPRFEQSQRELQPRLF